MAKNDFQYGGWNSYTLQCGTIVTLISPGDSTLHCGMWLWNRDSEFTKWQHLQYDTWLWDDMPLNSPKRPPYWNSTSGFDFDHITAVDICHAAAVSEVLSKSDHPRQKMTSCRFSRWRISATLDFRDPIMDALKNPVTTY